MNFIKMWTAFIIAILIPTLGYTQSAQTPDRHPRVLEVEKMLSKEALEFLRARFPGRPFIANVSIDPLRRAKKGDSQENLPFYDMAEEERFDEWDDPNISLNALVARVKKINLVLTVPADLSEDELTEIKTSLILSLGMLEARDSIEIRKRTWLQAPSSDASKLTNYHIIIIVAMVFLFLAGLLAITFTGTSRMANALKDVVGSKGGGGDATITMAPMPQASGGVGAGPGQGGGGGMGGTSDVKMLDSLKFLEHVTHGIKILASNKDFPRLEDMLIFENFATRNSSEFGAFLAEIPYELRMRLFGLSQSLHWLDAMVQPSDVGNLTLEQLHKCLRVQRNETEAAWHHMLILVWRLHDHADKFFHGVPEADALTIMAHLPKGVGVRWARAIFPGNWGQLLNPDFKPKPLNDLLIEKYSQKALSILPIRSADVLKNYQTEKEVLQYVRLAPIQAEKEVYLAAGETSSLRKLRPPFYPFFELSAEQYKEILNKFSIDDWGMALFNTPKPDRHGFEAQLSQKQKFRLYEVFRKLELTEASPQAIAEVRDRVGAQIATFVLEQQEENGPDQTPSDKVDSSAA
jgi:hypothetical protein